ncbi:vWA domain-containing protein [Actinomadura sp. SCN-SB]|uniref:vWA domain-containing protein n=1 Tax=Actinomadura sp. SCN-SB TaxID=3373092 RepID=UPI003752282B
MATHLNPATNPASATIARGAWSKVSAAFTGQISALTDRDDLIVTCAPGAGHGAPGCFIPALATIELDGVHLGHDPAGCDPSRPSDRERYPALWGVFVHEAAHARHSAWHATAATGTGPGASSGLPAPAARAGGAHWEAAVLLEESRIEAAHLARRPGDHRWLRACITQLVLADFTPGPPGATTAGGSGGSGGSAGAVRAAMRPWEAGCAAALILARVTTGVLDTDETAPVARAVCEVIGASRLGVLAELWCRAHQTADDDTAGMLELGRLWCDCLGLDPDQPPPPPEPDADGDSSPLAAAITATVEAITDADTPPAPVPGPDRSAERRAEKAARDQARQAASRVFADPPAVTKRGPTRITGTRTPTQAEQAAARRLARHLRTAAHRDRATATVTSPTPPGRLRMRDALAAEAQRAAGAVPTAEPFTRTLHQHVPAPPLRVGIACDVSRSMRRFAAPVASAAWIMARATGHVPDARSATVIFGATVRPVTRPGRTPARVHEFDADDGCHAFAEAVDALDAALDLSRPGTARLLVVVSDGVFSDTEGRHGQQRITRLTRSGCAVLWLALGLAVPMDGTEPVLLDDPADAATTIGQAAARALRTT